MHGLKRCLWLTATALLTLGLCLGLARDASAKKPGSILRVWPLVGGSPDGGEAFRILYRSTGLKGEPIAVSGAIYIPAGKPPAGGRRVIAYGHPTSGVVEKCAPSLMPDNAGLIWGLKSMLAKGYIVVATDYPGLGTPGIHPYLIGVSEGRAVLDSVRAAIVLPKSGASNRYVLWGHSQGGQAVLYAGEMSKSYAPELKLVGVAAAAPATYLVELFDADKTTSTGKELTAMAIYSWSNLYKDPASSLIEPKAMGIYKAMAHDCIESVPQFVALDKVEKPLEIMKFLKANPAKTEPWRSIMLKNTPGKKPAGAPVFLAQGTADTVVRPYITKQFGKALCKQGAKVMLVEMPGVTHTFAAKESVTAALKWMDNRFRGAPPPNSCGR
jgi:acetyl esterase/lipase